MGDPLKLIASKYYFYRSSKGYIEIREEKKKQLKLWTQHGTQKREPKRKRKAGIQRKQSKETAKNFTSKKEPHPPINHHNWNIQLIIKISFEVIHRIVCDRCLFKPLIIQRGTPPVLAKSAIDSLSATVLLKIKSFLAFQRDQRTE